MFKNKKAFLFSLIFITLGIFVFVPETQAQQRLDYTLLENIPGMDGVSGSDLPGYIQAIYRVALVVVTLSAVLMVSIGGFMYLTSAGNTSSMATAKTIIFDSLIGLVIALCAWLVLFVINPDLVRLSITTLSPTRLPAGGAAAPAPSPVTPGTLFYTHAEAAAALGAAGISVTSSGNCNDRNNRTCTSLEEIPQSTVANLIQLRNRSGCSFNVTGGTEVGHLSHGINRPIVDISMGECMFNYLRNQRTANTLGTNHNITTICAPRDEQAAAFNCRYIEAAPHFHLVFRP